MNFSRYFGLDRFTYLKEIVQHHGGWRTALWKLWINDDLKIGRLVGKDKFGNSYYENYRNFFGRDRWVEYAPHVRFEYDASMVCPEWHGWLHNKTDLTPGQEKYRPSYKWFLKHDENLTGTNCAYVPYSTTMPKIQAWLPPSNARKKKNPICDLVKGVKRK